MDDGDFTLYVGDVRDVLAGLPDESVHCVVTSPPYWGLRDYGTNGQLGLEPTPEEYVANMVAVFRDVRRVLRGDGTCWLNMGDSYANASKWGGSSGGKHVEALHGQTGIGRQKVTTGLKSKDLVGIPWRLAFALQADSWYLRADIIWSKPNPMPESVTDRPTKAHEYVFLLTRSPRYFFDQEAVREPFSGGTHSRGSLKPRDMPKSATPGSGIKNNSSMSSAIWGQAAPEPPQAETLDGSNGAAPRGPDGRRQTHVQAGEASMQHRDGERWPGTARNVRSVWEIATQPYANAHFATFPEALVERCVKAGTSERGCCPECGAPWERVVEHGIDESRPPARQNINPPEVTKAGQGTNATGSNTWGHWVKSETLGWQPSCSCPSNAAIPCTVFDPFLGSGTTALVARRLGRRSIGVELSEEYAKLAARRLQQLSLFGGHSPPVGGEPRERLPDVDQAPPESVPTNKEKESCIDG